MIADDAKYTVEEIADLTNINSSAVFRILKENLKLRKVCARWVPHLLSEEQKRIRVEMASQLLTIYEDCDQRRINEIVTGDETWIYFFEPETKLNNNVWIGENDTRPQIARRNRSVWRVMYALFFDSKGPVAQVPVPEHSSVTGQFYAENVLSQVVEHYKTTRPTTSTRGIKLLHDNAPAHRSEVVTKYLKENGIAVLPHPPYGPDLAPCDFWLNAVIKEALQGRRFESRHAVGSAVFQCMKRILKEDYRAAFSTWISRLKKCVQVNGDYVEGLIYM
ncbi:histone-lysine N-methyltransferase SETMAR-like [Saccostrea echinata]|uniref:histone-lysine N-methyltransferase SETMAR-like n=1 Tax=Saccostrea echinata TaxID=191078 RepID=UPI002A80F0FE|nr:histone-lysine N-methyltransferase SETMAR-like [Saccostrea echinata]